MKHSHTVTLAQCVACREPIVLRLPGPLPANRRELALAGQKSEIHQIQAHEVRHD